MTQIPALSIQWHSISQQQFMEQYWQKRPVVLKHALVDFPELTDENELAGLAMEEFVDSRIVERTQSGESEWQLHHGPFEDYSQWQSACWSLLVQGVDRYLPDVADLMNLVNFLPKWRVDDVMVSYSTAGAGVGLHLDQYDVFIVQGKGKRRWQAGAVDKSQCQVEIAEDLLQLDNTEQFVAIVDEVLEPGDILYVPPFSAHKGETLEDAINYSIGFRSPNQQELMSHFADYVLDNELGMKRYQSQDDSQSESFIAESDIEGLQQSLLALVNDKAEFTKFCIGQFTRATHNLDIAPVEPPYSSDEIIIELKSLPNSELIKTLGLRATIKQVEGEYYFACNGNMAKVSEHCASWLSQFIELERISNLQLLTLLMNEEQLIAEHDLNLLVELINAGLWYWGEE